MVILVRREIQEHDLSEPLRLTYRIIKRGVKEHASNLNVSLMTRRDVAVKTQRIRTRPKGSKRRKRTGVEYPVACRRVKTLVDLGLVIELPRKRGSRKGRLLDIPRPKPPSSRVIIARRTGPRRRKKR
jgi:hypothetical protein